MFLDENKNIFDTPQLMYYELRKEFVRKYLNPRAWKHEYGTKGSIQAYDVLLRYLEKTEELRDPDDSSFLQEIQSDNIRLVLNDLPFPPNRREEMHDHMLACWLYWQAEWGR